MGIISAFDEYKKRCPKNDAVTEWWMLYPGTSVKLESDYQQEILDEALEITGNYTILGSRIGICKGTISALHKQKRGPTIAHLKKLLSFLKRRPDDANKKIERIVRIVNPRLPFNLNSEDGAEIIAAFLSDGHLPKIPYKNPMYCAFERELHLRLISKCKKVFGDFKSEIRKGHRAPLTRFPSPIGTALERVGVPRGDKRLSNCYVPKNILDGDELIQRAYLRRVFDDEGDVHESKIKRAVRLTRSVDVGDEMASVKILRGRWIYGFRDLPVNNLLVGEYLILRNLGIDAKIYREGIYKSKKGRVTSKWRIQIAQQDNLKIFYEKIGFSHSVKKEMLKRILSTYINKKAPNGVTERRIWEHVRHVLEEERKITFGRVGRKLESLGMTRDYAGVFLRRFIRDKRIKKMRRGEYVIYGPNRH